MATVTARRTLRLIIALAAATLLAACARADKQQANTTQTGTQAETMQHTMTAKSSMSMDMGAGGPMAAQAPTVNGIHPVASQVLANSRWDGMEVLARTMTPASFVLFNGSTEHLVKPSRNTSFHLMVMLNDAHTGYAIPYAGVWATVLDSGGRTVYSDRQWPMLSEYMGPHYGNNVTLPGAGRYRLELLITPPVGAARHLEYAHVWLKQHMITQMFTWKPAN